jgi:hypothetical protein
LHSDAANSRVHELAIYLIHSEQIVSTRASRTPQAEITD